MEQKIEFILEWLTELCRGFEISRPTSYRLICRYERQGLKGLREHSRSPINHHNRTLEYVKEKILHLKKKHPRWGAKKIQVLSLYTWLNNQVMF